MNENEQGWPLYVCSLLRFSATCRLAKWYRVAEVVSGAIGPTVRLTGPHIPYLSGMRGKIPECLIVVCLQVYSENNKKYLLAAFYKHFMKSRVEVAE